MRGVMIPKLSRIIMSCFDYIRCKYFLNTGHCHFFMSLAGKNMPCILTRYTSALSIFFQHTCTAGMPIRCIFWPLPWTLIPDLSGWMLPTVSSHTSCARIPLAYIKHNSVLSLNPISALESGRSNRILTSSLVNELLPLRCALFLGIFNRLFLKRVAEPKSRFCAYTANAVSADRRWFLVIMLHPHTDSSQSRKSEITWLSRLSKLTLSEGTDLTVYMKNLQKQVYDADDIQKLLGIGRSKAYTVSDTKHTVMKRSACRDILYQNIHFFFVLCSLSRQLSGSVSDQGRYASSNSGWSLVLWYHFLFWKISIFLS